MEKSRTHYSILNITTGVLGYIVNTIFGFICRIIFVRCLASDYLGINGLFTNILTMLSLAELGIGSAIVYALYKPLAENDQEKIASLVNFYGKAYKIIGIVVGIIGLIVLPFLDLIIREQPNIKESITVIYLLYLFNTSSTYFFSYRSSLLMAAQQSYLVTGLNYVVTICQSIIQMIYLLLTKEYYGYLIIQTVGTFIYNFTISKIAVKKFPYIAKKDIKALDKEEKKSLVNNIRDLTLYKMSGLLVNSTDNIIITYFNGLSVSGITSNYTLFTSTLTSLLNQIFNGINSSVGNHNALVENEAKEKMFNNINLINFWLFGWAAVGVIFVSSDLVGLCFGSDYIMSIEIPIVLALNIYMVGMQNAVWTYKNTMGIFHYGRFMQFGTAILNIFFSILLGNILGVFGILFASAIARALTNTWYDPYCVYNYGFKTDPKKYFKKYLKYLIIILIDVTACYGICLFIDFNYLINVILKIIICSLVTNIFFILCFKSTPEYSYIKRILLNIFYKLMKKIR